MGQGAAIEGGRSEADWADIGIGMFVGEGGDNTSRFFRSLTYKETLLLKLSANRFSHSLTNKNFDEHTEILPTQRDVSSTDTVGTVRYRTDTYPVLTNLDTVPVGTKL